MQELLRLVRSHAAQHAPGEGVLATPLPGVWLLRVPGPTGLAHELYKPLLCLVLQGEKEVASGGELHRFAAGQMLVIVADRPVVGRVVRASRAEPYLALAIELDPALLREFVGQTPAASVGAAPAEAEPERVVFVHDIDEMIADGALRLMRLAGRPEAVPVLQAGIVRELHYWLLAGPLGASLRGLGSPGDHAVRISRAVAILRAEFARAIPISRLAAAAGMSGSSFHQHFKAVTSLSPLQFQKQLRLLEARRLLVSEGRPVSAAASAVGYASVAQFTREYRRLFDAPPRRDADAVRRAA